MTHVRKIIGLLLIASPFIAGFIILIVKFGLKSILWMLLIPAVVTTTTILGLYLLNK